MKVTEKEWYARAIAYLECAEHLRLHWTDDINEYQQGQILISRLEAAADKCFSKAGCD